MKLNLRKLSPAEIDTKLAAYHGAAQMAEHTRDYNEDRILDAAGMRHYQKSPVWGHGGKYVRTGTFAEARTLVETWNAAYDAESGTREYDDYSPEAHAGISTHDYCPRYLASYDQAIKDLVSIEAEIDKLDAEYVRRGGWTRTFLVVSSAGHLHSSTSCQTCRVTTRYGWWPSLSGKTEAEMIAELGDNADALCSVCYPDAPVAAKRKNISKAKAVKLAA